MNATIFQFPHKTTPKTEVAQFVRIGEFHRKFGDFHATGSLPLKRVVVEASRIERQAQLVKDLQNEGVEVVLDLGAAEVSSINRYTTHFKNAPWLGSPLSNPLAPGDYDKACIERMAQLAVKFAVSCVLSPTHYLADQRVSDWLNVDLRLCEMLRQALDENGGEQIAIDYSVIHSSSGISDVSFRKSLSEGLSNLPVDNLWFRISGLGKYLGPKKTRQMIRSLSGFHNLGLPMILDYSGGMTAQAALAFGSVSGAAFGINEFNQFQANAWHKPMPERDPDAEFGRAQFVQVGDLGRGFKKNEFTILAQARGGRRVLLPSGNPLANSIDEMIKNRDEIAAQDAVRCIDRIENVPDQNRERDFLDHPLKEMERKARDVSRLKPNAALAKELGVDLDSLAKRTISHFEMTEKVALALEKLHEERGSGAPRSRPCVRSNSNIQQTNLRKDDQ